MSDTNQEPDAIARSQSQPETIAILRDTVQRLEKIVQKLEADSSETLPPPSAVETLVDGINRLESAIAPSNTPPSETVEASPQEDFGDLLEDKSPVEMQPTNEVEDLLEERELGWIDRTLPSFDRLQAGWDWALAKIRTALPSFVSAKLSDWAITSILTGVVVLVLFSVVLLSASPPEPSTVAKAPPPPPPLPPPIEAPVEIEAPQEPEPIELEPPPPPPPVMLTPEQTLIAAIQNQVTELTRDYAEGLILSIEADFLGSRLLVTVGEEWYDLPESEQDRVANDISARSRELDFRKLEILDPQKTLLARTPVVGQGIVILQRRVLTSDLLPEE
ncbi:hypothetical protein [Lusitaniella coriacea]|uniref:hypothetical protein n=1 Tax=Lusitaniella coriacea TaxID=1983105 RepID=UPI003CFA513C